MRFLLAIFSGFLLLLAAACTSSDEQKARERAAQAGHEIKKEAKEMSREVNAAVQPHGSASNEMARADAKLDHAALLARVKAKLAADAGLSTIADVNVDLNGNEVTLSGTVANESQKKAAEIAAAQVDGVTRVRNRLMIQP